MKLQPRYVVNQVTAGDYDCPRKVLKFLTDLHAAFRMLNLRNDFLRKKFDGKTIASYGSTFTKHLDPLQIQMNFNLAISLTGFEKHYCARDEVRP